MLSQADTWDRLLMYLSIALQALYYMMRMFLLSIREGAHKVVAAQKAVQMAAEKAAAAAAAAAAAVGQASPMELTAQVCLHAPNVLQGCPHKFYEHVDILIVLYLMFYSPTPQRILGLGCDVGLKL